MKPAGLGLDEVTADDMILIDLDGNKLGGVRERHSEYPIHTEIYRQRPDVNCVVHTHPVHATALGATTTPLLPVSHEGVLFSNTPIFRETTMLIREPAQGRSVAACLGKHKAALLQNHSVVVVGTSIEEATIYAVLLERAARIQFLASSLGQLVSTADEEISPKAGQVYAPQRVLDFFAYYARQVERHRRR